MRCVSGGALLLCSLFPLSLPLSADSAPVGMAEVEALGRLNGQALACGYMELVPRAKGAMIHSAPKTREMGQAFHGATNSGYMALMERPGDCPPAPELRAAMESAVAALVRIFPPLRR